MKKTGLILVFVTLISGMSMAQNYDHAIGIRGGLFNGLTYKNALSSNAYFEGIFSTRWDGFMVTGLYEVANPIDANAPGLNWYYGFGAHIGFFDADNDGPWDDGDFDGPIIGADGILGIEYTFAEVPINLSLDWKPAINLFGYDGFWADNAAFAIRYTF